MATVRIPVGEDHINYVQMLHYEEGGLKILYATALKFDVPEIKVEMIKKEYIDAHNALELAKEELLMRYGPEYRSSKYNWSIDFSKGELVINEQ